MEITKWKPGAIIRYVHANAVEVLQTGYGPHETYAVLPREVLQ